MYKLTVTTCIFYLMTLHLQAQQRTVRGNVVAAENNQELPGVTLLIEGTTTGTITDVDGNYTISVPDNNTRLVFSFIGFEPQTIEVGNRSNIDVVLQASTVELQDIVVTALGIEEKKESLTYATQKLESRSVNVARTGDVSKQLRGLVPGMTITSNAGSGVSSSRIILRGEASLNLAKNEPLIILDGVPISNNFNGLRGSGTRSNQPVDYGNGLTDINPDDIADISILKGPKAAALYGTRAANGALVLRTTNGLNAEGLGITLTTGISFDQVTRFWDVQNKYSGGTFEPSKVENGEVIPNRFSYRAYGGWGLPLDGTLYSQPYYLDETPSESSLRHSVSPKDFFQTGITQNTHLAFRYSKNNVYGRMSFSRQDKTGILPNTGYRRNTISLHTGVDITDKLNINLTTTITGSGSDNLPVMGIGDDGREGIPYALIWLGNNIDFRKYENDYWYYNDKGERKQKGSPDWATNPWLIVKENLNKFDRTRFFGNIKAAYDFTESFSLFVRVGIDRYDDVRSSRRPSGQSYIPTGMYREQNIRFMELNADILASYNIRFDRTGLGLKALLGGNIMFQRADDRQTRISQLGLIDIYSFANALDVPVINQNAVQKQINSLYANVRLDYKNMIFLELTGRNDWSSTLNPSNNSFFYPSVGLSTTISKWVSMPDAISLLQIRGSFAQTGNDTDPQLINNTYQFGRLKGTITNPTLFVNPNLEPEITTAFEGGLVVGVLKDRISLETNIYANSSRGQILSVPVSNASGFTNKLINAGLIKNNGVEILLMGKPIKTKNIEWDIALNWSQNIGRIEELAPEVNSFIIAQGPALPGVIVQAVPGGRIGDIYGRQYVKQNGQTVWRNVNGVATASFAPRLTRLGNYNPDWKIGFNSTVAYKGVSLRIVGEYRHGGVLYTETGARLIQAGKDTDTTSPKQSRDPNYTVVPDGVMKNENGDYVPNTISQPFYNYMRRSRHWENAELNTFDASFFKLREISLSVDFKHFFPNIPLTATQLSLFARNVFTVTKSRQLRHFDPESFMLNNGTLVPGVESGQLPTPITYGFNLKIGI